MRLSTHRRTIRLGPAILLAAGLAGLPAMAQAQDAERSASVRVNLAEEGAPIPAGLYGIFMEEINHAFDGGLYAELIQNRSFEEGVVPPGMEVVPRPAGDQPNRLDGRPQLRPTSFPPGVTDAQKTIPWPWGDNAMWLEDRALVGWSLEGRGDAKGEMKLTEANPMNEASARSLEMTVAPPSEATKGAVALANGGYWGINYKEGEDYGLTFYLRPGTYAGNVTALLEDSNGRIIGLYDFGAVQPGNDWKKMTATIKATGSDAQGKFTLQFRGQGTLQVDWVSLFPPTWRDKPNGLRPDLAQYLADLKPAIVRYPGGCYVQGWSWESAPNWETMVKPPEARPGTYSYWKYRSTDGFGYHEFLQFSEDIGGEPLYVVNAGMTVHPLANVPMEDLGLYIQRALDAIEYANGPVDSKWGAVRAAMGHPAPFGLNYIEIGNEHQTADYADYYDKFRQAIKAKYPDVTVIMSMYWSGLNRGVLNRARQNNIEIDMVDEHAYHNNTWPRQNFNYFDRYDRTVPWTVFVGEYASQERTGNWGGGMGDSVYLMMMERNGDLVKMAAYAPLFVHIEDRTWNFNLIEYDSSRSFAHGSYYVQKLFNENRPDVNLATTTHVTEPAATEQPTPTPAARRGRGRGRGNAEPPWFFATAGYDRDDRTVVVKATNYLATPLPVEIQLDGAVAVGAVGKHFVIAGDDLRGDNTLDEPTRIVPREMPLTDLAATTTVTLPPLSVNVLRIPARKAP